MPLVLSSDRKLAWVILIMTLFGLMMVYSATASSAGGGLYFAKQAVAATIGLSSMYALAFLDYRRLRSREAVLWALGVCAGLLVLAAALGTGANTRRFLRLGVLSLQPSELAKPAMILYLAYYLELNRSGLSQPRTYFQPLAVLGLLGALIMLGTDFGTMACLAIIVLAMLYIAGMPVRFVAGLVPLALPLLYFVVWRVDYRRERLFAFLDPESDPLGSGFQILQSQIAVGSGGLFGLGWMLGNQKMHFLPEAHTDFIFALIGEEVGLLGAAALLAGFLLLLRQGVRASIAAPDLFGAYLAAGITSMVLIQAMLNLGVVLGLLPTKGMPLPLISYGGTSLMVTLASCGVLLNVSRFRR